MKTRRIFFPGTFAVDREEKEIPDRPEPAMIYVKNRAGLISPGTELSLYTGIHSGLKDPKNTWAKFPFHPGYSSAGEVIAVGEKVTGFRPGDRVIHLGTHDSVSAVAAADAVKLPAGLSEETAVFSVLGYISMQGVRLAGIQLGETVVVVGAGLVGQLAVQFSRLNGAGLVVCSDLSEPRLKLAGENGARALINPGRTDPLERIKELTEGRQAEVVIEATGSPAVIPEAVRLAANLGRVILLGSPRGKVEMDFYPDVHSRGIQIIGGHVATAAKTENQYNRWTRDNSWRLTMELLARGEIKVGNLVTQRIPASDLEGIRKGYEGLLKKKDEFLAVTIDWEK